MGKGILMLFLLISVPVAAVAQTREETLAEIEKLKVTLAELSTLSEKLQKRVAKPLTREDEKGVRLALMQRIKPPIAPCRDAVRNYIAEIMIACKGQYSFGFNDPPVAMLSEAIEMHLEVALDAYLINTYNTYLTKALENTITVEQKDYVLEGLETNKSLASLVYKHGWVEEARDVLLSELRKHQKVLPVEWIQSAAQLKEPASYGDLLWYLENGANRWQTCVAIKDLPGMDPAKIVSITWEKSEPGWSRGAIAPLAIEYGYIDALEYVVNALTEPQTSRKHVNSARDIVVRTLPEAKGENEEIQAWFNANKALFVFDPASKNFKLKGEGK